MAYSATYSAAFYVGVPRSSQDKYLTWLRRRKTPKIENFLILRFTPAEYLSWLAYKLRYALRRVKRRRLNSTLGIFDHMKVVLGCF